MPYNYDKGEETRFFNVNLLDSIYGSYVRGDRLAKLVYDTYSNSSIQNATKLNIMIDINSVIHALYSENNRVQYNNITDLSSGIINLCAHYRSYFRTIGVETKFFLINSTNSHQICRKIYPDYNAIFIRKTEVTKTDKIIVNNMNLLKVLCPYLPGIYYIESVEQFDVGVIMAHIIEEFGINIPNLIISKDLYNLQLTALYKYTSFLKPVKYHKEDRSWMVPINEKLTYRQDFWDSYKLDKRRVSSKSIYEISPVNFSLFLALTNFVERNMGTITNGTNACKFIQSIVGSEDIKISINQFMNNEELANIYPVAEISSRYKVLDIQYMLPYYKNSPECKSLQFLDLEDSPTVNRISSKYYQNNPLDLQRL